MRTNQRYVFLKHCDQWELEEDVEKWIKDGYKLHSYNPTPSATQVYERDYNQPAYVLSLSRASERIKGYRPAKIRGFGNPT